MISRRALLSLAFVLALSGGAFAQEGAVPGASGGELPFMNDGANRPVLQTISPDGVAIAPEAMPAPMPPEPVADAAHEGGAEHKKGLPQFDVTTFPKQIVWLALAFGVMYFVFSRKTLPAIASILDARSARIAHDITTAEELKVSVEKLRTEYESSIASAQAEAQKLMAEAQEQAGKLAFAHEEEFKAKAHLAVEKLEERVAETRTRLVAELQGVAASLSVDIAAQVAGVRADDAAAVRIVSGIAAADSAHAA